MCTIIMPKWEKKKSAGFFFVKTSKKLDKKSFYPRSLVVYGDLNVFGSYNWFSQLAKKWNKWCNE